MKESKSKPIAKLTEVQLTKLRSIITQIDTLGNALERSFHRRQEFMDDVKRAYGLGDVDFYIEPRTGEAFETWPELKT